MASNTIYTIGHSTRTVGEFVEIISSVGVKLVVDIRTVPRSRTNPQYNLDIFPSLLEQYGIFHMQLSKLGGLRKRSNSVPIDTNAFWDNRSFHNYADYALSEDFQEGLQELIEVSKERLCVIMCSEAVWWRCHRRIVADYLIGRNVRVFHLMDRQKVVDATLTPNAKLVGTKVLYPRG